MRRPLLPGERREYYDALRADAEERIDRTLFEGRRLRRAIRAKMLEIEIERLPQKPFKLPLWRKPDVLARSLAYGLLASPLAWGLYDIAVESGQSLLKLALIFAGLSAAFLIIGLVVIDKVKPEHRRFVRPVFLLSALAILVAGWLFWQHLRHPGMDITELWHYYVSDPLERHGDRKTVEGIVIAIVGLSAAYNVYSLGRLLALQRPPHWWDRLEYHARVPNKHDDRYRRDHNLPQLSAWQIFAAWGFWQYFYSGLAALLFLRLAAHLLHWSIPEVGPDWARVLEDPATGSVIYLVVGLTVGPLAKRPIQPIIDELFKWRAEAFVRRHGKDVHIRWYHHLLLSPYYIERIIRTAALAESEFSRQLQVRSGGVKASIVVGILVVVGIWAYGLHQMLKVYGVIH